MRVPRLALYSILCAVSLLLVTTFYFTDWLSPMAASNPWLENYNRKHHKALDDPTLIASIPHELVPTAENRRRLVIVGDVHGMYNELEQMLQKVDFNPDRDHLVAAGDMISKGPNSPAVVSLMMELGASAVRGNHENSVLMAWAETLGGQTNTKAKEKHMATARELSAAQLEWLASLPIILSATPLPIVIVHGGLVPGVKLVDQDPWAIMNMRTLLLGRGHGHGHGHQAEKAARSLDPRALNQGDEVNEDIGEADLEDTLVTAAAPEGPVDYSSAVPSANRQGIPWADAWNAHQKRLLDFQRRTVIYGHDAKRGFRVGDYTFGLDSNCVGGGSLTALVLEAAADEGFKHRSVQVTCKKSHAQG
ncbi:hypothetical protein S40288_00761 [Stachybotrys chartarum IBT 40288]|nr:hypothetical protein S40288_00761 [Stachybotrys chartarum IBT 40288]